MWAHPDYAHCNNNGLASLLGCDNIGWEWSILGTKPLLGGCGSSADHTHACRFVLPHLSPLLPPVHCLWTHFLIFSNTAGWNEQRPVAEWLCAHVRLMFRYSFRCTSEVPLAAKILLIINYFPQPQSVPQQLSHLASPSEPLQLPHNSFSNKGAVLIRQDLGRSHLYRSVLR